MINPGKTIKEKAFSWGTLLISIAIFSCSSDNAKAIEEPPMITSEIVKNLSDKNIYFAHMSVGYNIIDGISSMTDELKIRYLNEEISDDAEAFLHSEIGENRFPLTKINDFYEKISGGLGDRLDIAFLKFCYIDFNASTDVKSLFIEYRDKMLSLEEKYPNVTFVHFTSPLTTRKKGIKAYIKNVIGREVPGYGDNVKREEYNKMIRESFSNVFDLARIESTKPNGNRLAHKKNGKLYYSLVESYTDDGGHLNSVGAKLVAEKFLLFLSELN
ncbi:hypothetical protein [Marispirochaeta aestuarii]|uniref:hypothetical protein n=1 Tax=Marispirochaeta aestuarii TaxID=1963862 RepID=UPI0029C63023|nr:hypothetical protein [Marispirochaeta aestuarii]